jgi:hypothetical protein
MANAKWQDMLLLLERKALSNLYDEFKELEEREGRGLSKEEFADSCLRNIDLLNSPYDEGTLQC